MSEVDKPEDFVKTWATRLGIADLAITLTPSPRPGGDVGNSAHIHWEPGYTNITIEFDPEDEETDVAIVHELLHLVYRHVGETKKGILGSAGEWFMSALEEDTESLAQALVKSWP